LTFFPHLLKYTKCHFKSNAVDATKNFLLHGQKPSFVPVHVRTEDGLVNNLLDGKADGHVVLMTAMFFLGFQDDMFMSIDTL